MIAMQTEAWAQISERGILNSRALKLLMRKAHVFRLHSHAAHDNSTWHGPYRCLGKLTFRFSHLHWFDATSEDFFFSMWLPELFKIDFAFAFLNV